MTSVVPAVIRLTKPNGDFYEGVSLAVHKGHATSEFDRIRLYVTASNIDSLSGTTEPGTIVEMALQGWTVGPMGGGDDLPEGVFEITDKDGVKRRSLMDQREYDGWRNGDTVETYGLRVVPKRDFGSTGYYSAKMRSNSYEGWVVVYTKGQYKGCHAMPGAVWASTKDRAVNLIMAYIAAGGSADSDVENPAGFVDRFHALLCRLTKDA